MLKNILNLNGAQALNKSEQQTISGGCPTNTCPSFAQCYAGCSGIGSYCAGTSEGMGSLVCYTCVRIGLGEQ